MKIKRTAVALAAMASIGVYGTATAQISDDVIKIGFLTDMSGLYADIDGQGGVEAIRMAIADMGGEVNGKKIELLYADHQNKADIAASKAREWFDREGMDMLIGGTNSGANMSMAGVAAEKKKPYLAVGGASALLTNEQCTPYTIHYAYDTVALANGTGSAIVKEGGDTWFFMTADYAFGTSLQNDTSAVIEASGGEVLGSVRHPLSGSDFSSYLLQAQASNAKILGLANAGSDAINTIKAANEFGVTSTMKLAGLLMFISEIHALGLEDTQGMYLTAGWYWDRNDDTREWSKRYFEKMNRMPTLLQSADYSATMQYLKAVEAAGTDDGDKVMEQLRKTEINDFFAENGYIRGDGRMIHDMYLVEVKKPSESKYPWDYYRVVQTIPGDQAFATKEQSKCANWQ